MAKISISLCMIVKDEEELLENAIKSVQTHMEISDIVVADTGSEDRTKEVAEKCGARVFDFEWCKDFSAARNFAASKAENDWIIFLDADEEIVEANITEIEELLDDEKCIGIIMMIELANNSTRRVTRLYNRRTHDIKGRIHENISPKKGIKSKRIQLPILTNHRGYLPELWKRKEKFERNEAMLKMALKEKPNDPYLLYQLGKCYFSFNRDLEKAGECFEKTLAICDEVEREYIYDTVECYGYTLLNTERYRDALNLLEAYTDFYWEKPDYRFLMAHIYQNNAMFIEAVGCYETCIGADMFDTKGITSFLSYYNIGVILEIVGMIEDAVDVYKECGDYPPAVERLKALGMSS